MRRAMSALPRRRIRSLLAWLAVIVAAVALAWGPDDVLAQEDQPSGDVDLGGQLYAQACAQCHASDGRGAVVPGSDGLIKQRDGRRATVQLSGALVRQTVDIQGGESW